jgi:hypothetical protein
VPMLSIPRRRFIILRVKYYLYDSIQPLFKNLISL